MLYKLKRHPFVMRAVLERTLVLTYALPAEVLESTLPPGLTVDKVGDLGFLAIALVQARDMRPAFLPQGFGLDFFLAGYRILTRYATTRRKKLRGLRIMETLIDKKGLIFLFNLISHYRYCAATVQSQLFENAWRIRLTANSGVVLDLIAELDQASLPQGTPFNCIREARKYAGPLPFTFDYEPETNSIVIIEGVRQYWNPRPVAVHVISNTFLEKSPFRNSKAFLASAFYVENVPYLWKRGVVERLGRI